MSRSLRAYRRRRTLLVIMLLAYPLLAVFGPQQGRAEFYPFFSWNLFSRSLPFRRDAILLVNEVDGRRLDRSTAFYDLGEFFAAARTKDIRLAKMIDNFLAAERSGDSALSEHLLDVIRNTFMSEVTTAKFDIGYINYNVLNRYRTGEIGSVDVVRSAEKR
jgi:hypothetical protein